MALMAPDMQGRYVVPRGCLLTSLRIRGWCWVKVGGLDSSFSSEHLQILRMAGEE